MINYYHILGISTKASQREIKEAYRKLALRYHPDKNPDSTYAEDRFKEISQAYHVLRDPSRKAQHDFALTNEAFNAQTSYSTQTTNPYTNWRQQQPPPYSYRRSRKAPGGPFQPPPPSITSRENLVATAWAFGIFFVLAVIVLGFSSYRSYQQEKLKVEQNELAVNIYQKAEEAFQQQNYSYSLHLLKTIGTEYQVSYDVSQLKDEILFKLKEEADSNYEQKEYARAAELFQEVVNHQNTYDPLAYAKLVSSYEMIGDYPHAIEAYKQVIRSEPLTIEARSRIAALYNQMENYDQALKYYLQASDIIIREYENYYGKAYALMVNPIHTPESHYHMHCGLAHTYSELGMLKEADSALKWAIFLRPEFPEAYYLKGITLFKAQKFKEACQAWEMASKKGSKEAAQKLKDHCR